MQADVFLTPRTTARAMTSAGATWLTVNPDDDGADRVVLFLGDHQSAGHLDAVKVQLRALIAACRQAADQLGIALDPVPGPDEPDDEPTDEPVLRADGQLGTDRQYAERVAQRLMGDAGTNLAARYLDTFAPPSSTCLTCGHAGPDHTAQAPCLTCSASKVPGSCATSAIVDAYERGQRLAASAPWSESELRFAAGDR